jgi:hypothetical protein
MQLVAQGMKVKVENTCHVPGTNPLDEKSLNDVLEQ